MLKHMVFEYLYRDASNFKAWGELLLEGELSEAEIDRLCARFDGGEFFIAEQIGVPTLYEMLWRQCQSEPSEELDHMWHQFSDIRAANNEDISRLTRWKTATWLLETIEKVDSWDLELSRNWGQ